jgi:hypothetical protein
MVQEVDKNMAKDTPGRKPSVDIKKTPAKR